jgi:hypothetical protein
MVETTEGCNINRGKCAKRVKSTKFVNKFCRLASHYLRFQNSQKILENIDDQAIGKKQKPLKLASKFSCKTARWGRVTFFLKKTSLLP